MKILEPLPRAVLRRQLGFNCGSKKPIIDTKSLLQNLKCSDEDIARVAENDENLFDQIPIYDIKFCPVHFHPYYMAVTDELGYVTIVSSALGLGEEDKIVLKEQCHDNALFNIDWSPHTDGVLATCAGDQLVKVWDIKKDFGNVATFKGHERTVKSIKFHPKNPDCLASSGRDGTVRCWDIRTGDSAVNIIRNAHGINNRNDQVSVTDIVFHDENTVISCGAKDGVLKMWDLRKTYTGLKKMVPVSTFGWINSSSYEIKGYHSLCLDSSNNLYASTYHEVLKFNLSSDDGQSDPAHYVAPDAFNPYVKINTSPDGRFLISGSSVSEAYLWDTWDSSEKPFMVLKSAQPASQTSACVATFSPHDSLTVVSGNDEGRIFVWRPCFEKDVNPNKVISASQLSAEEADLVVQHAQRIPSTTFKANSREASISKLKTFGPKDSRHFAPTSVRAVSRASLLINLEEPKEEIDMKSLLKDLPNFVMDGTHPSLPEMSTKAPKTKPCWLGGLTKKLVIKNSAQMAEKRSRAATLTSQDLNVQEEVQPVVKKLKLSTPKTKSPKPRTPTSRARNTSTTTPRSNAQKRRNSVDNSSTLGKSSPGQNILKYFSVDRSPSLSLASE